jgi:hypothetical protein
MLNYMKRKGRTKTLGRILELKFKGENNGMSHNKMAWPGTETLKDRKQLAKN